MEISQEAIEASLVAVLSVLLHISISGLQWIQSHFILLYYRLLKFLDQEIVIIWSQSLRLHVYSRLECSPYATPGHLNFWTFIRPISHPPMQKLRLRSPTHVVELSKVTFKHLLEVTMNCYLIFHHTMDAILPIRSALKLEKHKGEIERKIHLELSIFSFLTVTLLWHVPHKNG